MRYTGDPARDALAQARGKIHQLRRDAEGELDSHVKVAHYTMAISSCSRCSELIGEAVALKMVIKLLGGRV